MVPIEPPYPSPPRNVPAELGRAPAAWTAGRALGLAAGLLGISLFLVAPVAAAAGALGCLLASDWWIVFRAGGFIVLSALALVYLKSLLPRRIPRPAAAFPVLPADQPRAYRFVERVAEDTNAVAPRRLLIASGVELRLGGYRSLLDLVRTGRWELHIGLWLWHFVTLSELQALVARTLAPLSGSRAERLAFGARGLLAALADGDDHFDELAAGDHPLAPIAAALTAVFRAVTHPLRMTASVLLRVGDDGEQCGAADLVAVRVAGSDALVHAVLRADFAGAALRELDEALFLAGRDGVFTRDIYAHAGEAATFLREDHNDFTLGEPPTLRGPTAGKYADVFEPGRRYLSDVWRGMPLGDAREQNAKKVFVAAEQDDRPATDLLDDPAALRDRLTRLRYLEVLGVAPDFLPVPPETVRRWLSSHDGPVPAARYAGSYDGGRRIEPGTPAERDAALASPPRDDAGLLAMATGLYDQAADKATTWRRTRSALDRLMIKTLYAPAGRTHAMADDLREDLDKAGRWLAALDRWAYVVHVHMAARLPDLALHDDLLRRYESVLRFQPLAADAREYRNRVGAFARKLAAYPGPIPYRLGRDAHREFTVSSDDLEALLNEARGIRDPLLSAWTGDVPLSEFLHSHDERPDRAGRSVEEFGRLLLSAWEEVTAKARWLHRLGVAELLTLHERIAAEFSAQLQSRGAVAGDTAIDLEPLSDVPGPDPVDRDGRDDPLSPSA